MYILVFMFYNRKEIILQFYLFRSNLYKNFKDEIDKKI